MIMGTDIYIYIYVWAFTILLFMCFGLYRDYFVGYCFVYVLQSDYSRSLLPKKGRCGMRQRPKMLLRGTSHGMLAFVDTNNDKQAAAASVSPQTLRVDVCSPSNWACEYCAYSLVQNRSVLFISPTSPPGGKCLL